jgi:hypothetical protein
MAIFRTTTRLWFEAWNACENFANLRTRSQICTKEIQRRGSDERLG